MTAAANVFMLFAGVSCGMTVAAGIFTFITTLGIVTRLAQVTQTADRLMCYETWICAGAVSGNLWWLFMSGLYGAEWIGEWLLKTNYFFKSAVMTGFALLAGIFTGCLIGAVAEILDAFPIMFRRIGLKEGTAIVVIMLAAGKFTGVILQFF